MIQLRWWFGFAACSGVVSAAPSSFAQEISEAPARQPQARAAAFLSAAPPAPARKKQLLILGMRLPAFLSFGVGGLAAGGAATTGLLASGRYNDPKNCAMHCPEHRANGLLVTSGVLAGLAAASIGTGIALLLTAPKPATERNWVPALRLRLSAQRAGASVSWAF